HKTKGLDQRLDDVVCAQGASSRRAVDLDEYLVPGCGSISGQKLGHELVDAFARRVVDRQLVRGLAVAISASYRDRASCRVPDEDVFAVELPLCGAGGGRCGQPVCQLGQPLRGGVVRHVLPSCRFVDRGWSVARFSSSAYQRSPLPVATQPSATRS